MKSLCSGPVGVRILALAVVVLALLAVCACGPLLYPAHAFNADALRADAPAADRPATTTTAPRAVIARQTGPIAPTSPTTAVPSTAPTTRTPAATTTARVPTTPTTTATAAPTAPPTPVPTATPTPIPIAPTTATAALPAATTAPVPTVPTTASAAPAADPAWLQAVLQATNDVRADHGLPPLQAGQAAALHAAAVRAHEIIDLFSHDRPGGAPWHTALTDAGVAYRKAGENIAAGYLSPEAAVTGWMNSEGHRKNILNPDFTHLAVGYCYLAGSQYRHYTVQLFYTPPR